VGIDRLSPGKRNGNSAQGEVTCRQIRLDRLAAKRRCVELPTAIAGDGPPGRELGRELEGMPVTRARNRSRRPLGIAGDGEVEIGDLTTQGGVAHRPSGDPNLRPVLRQRVSGQGDQRRGLETVGEGQARTLGTRAEIPQVIS